MGLHFRLDAFDVEVDPCKPLGVLAVRDPLPIATPRTLVAIPTPEGYEGALATDGPTDVHVFRVEWTL